MARILIAPYTIKDVKANALTIEQLKKLSTQRLLAYYKKYRHLRFYNIRWCCEFQCCDQSNAQDKVLTAIGVEYIDSIKALLATREHVPA